MRLTSPEFQRFSRHLRLPGFDESIQMRLKAAHVLVVGAGGLGCPVLQYLRAAGIGRISIIDADRVEASNLQRQILFTPADIGRPKAEVAAARLRELSEFGDVCPIVQRFDAGFESDGAAFDVVVDGTDNFAAKYAIDAYCVRATIPWVFASLYQFVGQLAVFNVMSGGKRSPRLTDLFPTPPGQGVGQNCAEAGVVGAHAGVVGAMQALEVIKVLTGLGQPLAGKLLVIDALSQTYETYSFESESSSRDHAPTLSEHCGTRAESVSWGDAIAAATSATSLLLDVRDSNERVGRAPTQQSLHIPLAELPEKWAALTDHARIDVFCHSGWRSEKAAQFLRGKLGTKTAVHNVAGGMLAYPA